jgi:ParB family chromosome partitioning protein
VTAAASGAALASLAVLLPLDALQPAASQPRTSVDEGKLEQLAASIRARGRLVQPIVGRPLGADRYEIVCGERRWRAARSAGLAEVPVVVRDLSDQEAFEESLAENLDREDMTPLDEIRAVARIAGEYGVVEAAKRLGKPHHWASKRKRIAEAPACVLAFVESGGSSDIEALYELAKLADLDAAAAEAIIADHAEGGRLREAVKAALRARREDVAGDDERAVAGEAPPLEESFRLEDRGAAAAAAGGDEEEEPDDNSADAGDAAGENEPSWLPSDAPELDDPFDADPAVLVTGVEARRAGHLVFATSNGPITYELTSQARDQLLALLR